MNTTRVEYKVNERYEGVFNLEDAMEGMERRNIKKRRKNTKKMRERKRRGRIKLQIKKVKNKINIKKKIKFQNKNNN
jgi:hypothetical protein